MNQLIISIIIFVIIVVNNQKFTKFYIYRDFVYYLNKKFTSFMSPTTSSVAQINKLEIISYPQNR